MLQALIDDDKRSGGATMPKSLENFETVKQIVLENHRITIKEVA